MKRQFWLKLLNLCGEARRTEATSVIGSRGNKNFFVFLGGGLTVPHFLSPLCTPICRNCLYLINLVRTSVFIFHKYEGGGERWSYSSHVFVIFVFIRIKYISTFTFVFIFIYLCRRSDGWERPLCKFALPQCEFLCPRLFIYLYYVSNVL